MFLKFMPTAFQERVYAAVRRIPRGRVSTYKEVARAVGCGAYRAVGRALYVNPYAPRVPCHRVVCSDGSLGGFARGVEEKKKMLEAEGVWVVGGGIDLSRYFVAVADEG